MTARKATSNGSRQLALGRYGEDLAAQYLGGRGMTIIDRNWRCRAGEIDLVALDGDVLVVCEVKTRVNERFGGPKMAITPAKLSRLRRLTGEWLRAHPPTGRTGGIERVRIDFVGVLIPTRGEARIEHLLAVV